MKKFLLTILAGCSLSWTVGAAQAENIVLQADKTIMITLAERPGTVVVGNPAIADISINSNTLFLHGRGYGNTNMIVLDVTGKQLANFDVSVRVAETDALTFFTERNMNQAGVVKFSYNCSPLCERSLQIMDTDYRDVGDSMKTKNELATGSKTAEAEAPSAAQ
jgi:hypothetical protein